MALPLSEKKALVAEIKETFESSDIVLLASVERMSVAEITALRAKLRPETVRFKMYKNTLVKRAMTEIDPDNPAFQKLGESLKGFTLVASTPEKPLAACKILSDTAKEDERVRVKAAVFENRFVSADGVKELAGIGSKDMLIARLLGALKSPITRLHRSLTSPQSNLVLVLKAVADKQEKG